MLEERRWVRRAKVRDVTRAAEEPRPVLCADERGTAKSVKRVGDLVVFALEAGCE